MLPWFACIVSNALNGRQRISPVVYFKPQRAPFYLSVEYFCCWRKNFANGKIYAIFNCRMAAGRMLAQVSFPVLGRIIGRGACLPGSTFTPDHGAAARGTRVGTRPGGCLQMNLSFPWDAAWGGEKGVCHEQS